MWEAYTTHVHVHVHVRTGLRVNSVHVFHIHVHVPLVCLFVCLYLLQAQLLCDGKLIHSASPDSAGFFDFFPVPVDAEVCMM